MIFWVGDLQNERLTCPKWFFQVMQKFISYIALNQMKFREFIREHVQSWTCCLAVTSCMDFWKRFQFHCLRETWILRSETLIWFRKHDSECGETNDQINATQLLNLWSTKVAFDNGTKFTLFEPRKKMKQVWKIWLQQVWKNMIDFFFMSTWNDPRKRFESCLKRRFHLTMESIVFGLTHANGSNHLSTKGLMWQWNQVYLVWLRQKVRIIFQQKVWFDNGITLACFDSFCGLNHFWRTDSLKTPTGCYRNHALTKDDGPRCAAVARSKGLASI